MKLFRRHPKGVYTLREVEIKENDVIIQYVNDVIRKIDIEKTKCRMRETTTDKSSCELR